MPVCSDFCIAYLMGRDKRGVSAKFLQRELGVAYQTAWTMAHKLRHLPQRPQYSHELLEARDAGNVVFFCGADLSAQHCQDFPT